MDTLTCDVCKKVVEKPITERTHWHYKSWDICEACKDDMDWKLRPVVRGHYPFDYGWYDQLVSNTIEEAIQQGGF